ncbi:MAG TPA: hypothetical protein VEK06_03995, partial [Myxococcota bacterium]|nr:hypothetical protein [Myxococcota bacterium]
LRFLQRAGPQLHDHEAVEARRLVPGEGPGVREGHAFTQASPLFPAKRRGLIHSNFENNFSVILRSFFATKNLCGLFAGKWGFQPRYGKPHHPHNPIGLCPIVNGKMRVCFTVL